jgi:hypothetical protein
MNDVYKWTSAGEGLRHRDLADSEARAAEIRGSAMAVRAAAHALTQHKPASPQVILLITTVDP